MGEPFSWIIRYLAHAGIFAPVPLMCGPVIIHWKSCETRNSMMRCVLATLTLSNASSNASNLGALAQRFYRERPGPQRAAHRARKAALLHSVYPQRGRSSAVVVHQ